jgi:hypothetical protein
VKPSFALEDGNVESVDHRYRYLLTRELDGFNPPLVFCMLNPSTANATDNDPTIRRCIGFANREHACSLIVVNLYAFRATNPADLPILNDPFGWCPIGPENDYAIRSAANGAKRMVCAWGANADRKRVKHVCTMLRHLGVDLVCLGTTKHGHPRHPLYVKADQPLVHYSGDLQ